MVYIGALSFCVSELWSSLKFQNMPADNALNVIRKEAGGGKKGDSPEHNQAWPVR